MVEEPFEPAAGRAASMLVNVPALIALHRSQLAQLRADPEAAAAFASAALAESRTEEWLLASSAQGHLAMAEWLRGRLTEAEGQFESILTGRRAADQPTMTAYGCYQLGQIQRAQGRLDAAVRTYRQALEATVIPGQPPPPVAGPAAIGLAEVALPAERARRGAPAGQRGYRAMPPARLHRGGGGRPGDPGVDPAGHW